MITFPTGISSPGGDGAVLVPRPGITQDASPQPDPAHASGEVHPRHPPDRMLDIFRVAQDYTRLGFSVVPQLPGAKHPCVKWKPFQERRPTEEEFREWLRRWPNAGLAVVLGPVSNLFAIDVDGPEAHEALTARLGREPWAPKVLSGSGKPHRFHLFFRHPDVPTLAKFTPWHNQLEFRGHRGIIILPPSLHKSGNSYRFAPGQSFDDVELPELPPLIVEELLAKSIRSRARSATTAAGADRNHNSGLPDWVWRLASSYIARMPPAIQGNSGDRTTYGVACRLVLGFGLTPDQAFPLLQAYNQRCEPPWTEEELRHKLERAALEPGERGQLLRPPPARPTSLSLPAQNRGQPDGPSPSASVPVLASLRDFGMIDPDRMNVFELIGRTHGLFGGVAEWPTRDEVLEQVSSGKFPNAHEAFRDVARGPGGFVDTRGGRHWAVRLIPKTLTGDDGRYHLFAFARERAAAYLEADKRVLFNKEKDFQLGWFPEDAWREHLSQVAKRLRFFRPAGRLLWYLHGRVLALGSVKLLLSDVELGTVV
ncbi:MAG TPA: bifunctional DNA primase/polymerase, partial [Gemmataceae bacterium]|nr:bifunctional DNA primase/polymerase [Gemmataceae bacterium]